MSCRDEVEGVGACECSCKCSRGGLSFGGCCVWRQRDVKRADELSDASRGDPVAVLERIDRDCACVVDLALCEEYAG
jgi:hypothetical protein